MPTDPKTLNFAAAVLCGIGSLATLVSALLSDGPKGTNRAGVMSGLFGIVGSAAWAASAYADLDTASDGTVEAPPRPTGSTG